jgi:hypothetical protein
LRIIWTCAVLRSRAGDSADRSAVGCARIAEVCVIGHLEIPSAELEIRCLTAYLHRNLEQ